MGTGVAFGANKPNQETARKSFNPASSMVGTSGSSGSRRRPAIANARNLPALIGGPSVAIDAKGKLYGTTFYGGAYNDGTVFEVQYANQKWNEKVLHSFNWTIFVHDGTNPSDGMIFYKTGD